MKKLFHLILPFFLLSVSMPSLCQPGAKGQRNWGDLYLVKGSDTMLFYQDNRAEFHQSDSQFYFAGSVVLPFAMELYHDSVCFMHNYFPPGAHGDNIFFGDGAGSTIMSKDPAAPSVITNQCSWNIAIGPNSMGQVKTAHDNIAIGESVMHYADHVNNCIAIGYTALRAGDSAENTIVIGSMARRTDPYAVECIDIGNSASKLSLNGYRQIHMGNYAGFRHNGPYSILIGNHTAYHTTYSNGSHWLLIGDNIKVPASLFNTDNLVNIAGVIYNYDQDTITHLVIDSYTDTVVCSDHIKAASLSLSHLSIPCFDTIYGASTIHPGTCGNIVLYGDVPCDSVSTASPIGQGGLLFVEVIGQGATGGLLSGNNLVLDKDFIGQPDRSTLILQRRGNDFIEF